MGTSEGTVVNTVMKVFDPVKCGKSLIGRGTVSVSRTLHGGKYAHHVSYHSRNIQRLNKIYKNKNPFQKLIEPQLVTEFPHFMDQESSLPCS